MDMKQIGKITKKTNGQTKLDHHNGLVYISNELWNQQQKVFQILMTQQQQQYKLWQIIFIIIIK
ncbi:hypothetical protein DERF_014854 [Dermatophagoides farinae]|uniref:Uncharacterized protein n=1 Tax=Dermatophagoides farinae TaxID=6954 RepID=A0A922KTW4_DERFA|nr:hypothetical protein DERF_014854 [Dermatophagoides farinae]